MPPVVDEKGLVTKEGKPAEVQAFRDYCWPDAPVYLDEPRAFYNALGGGKANKSTLASFLAKIANPWSRLRKNAKRAKDDKGDAVEGNLVGEGFVHGGVYVVQAGGKPYYVHAEAEIGDHPPTEELLAALPEIETVVGVEAVSVEK